MTRLTIAWWDMLAPPLVACAALASITVAAGCALTSQEEIGVAQGAALNPNALNPNALNPNALNPNALNPNALNPNAMSPAAMSAVQDPGASGDLSRELLRYMVSCAFTLAQSFDFSWIDANNEIHVESYPGLLGLAPSWATQPLDLAGQQWVSSCLASRVNAKGVSVMLSSRGTNPALASTPAERAAYNTREAVFFGNLFTNSPKVYACYDPLSVLPSQMANRVCAQPDLLNIALGDYSCGPIEVVGPCTWVIGLLTLGVCASENATARYFYNCKAPGTTNIVPSMTTFLQGPISW